MRGRCIPSPCVLGEICHQLQQILSLCFWSLKMLMFSIIIMMIFPTRIQTMMTFFDDKGDDWNLRDTNTPRTLLLRWDTRSSGHTWWSAWWGWSWWSWWRLWWGLRWARWWWPSTAAWYAGVGVESKNNLKRIRLRMVAILMPFFIRHTWTEGSAQADLQKN